MTRSLWILVLDHHVTLCVLGRCTLKKAVIVVSILAKVKVPPKFQFSGLHLNPLHDMSSVISQAQSSLWKRARCMICLQSRMQQPRDSKRGWGKFSNLLCTVHVV